MTDQASGDTAAATMRHPHHDAVAREVRRWYTASFPEIGIHVDQYWFGFLAKSALNRARLVLTVDDPSDVPPALEAARATCPDSEVTVLVDDHGTARRLDGALRESGYAPRNAAIYLALVGDPTPLKPPPAGLRIDAIGQDRLELWARVKLRAFSGAEVEPAASDVAAEVAARRAERALAAYQLGSIDGQPATALAYYPGPDQLVFLLGTRVPFRHRGIAQAMLHRWAEDGRSNRCRSLVINAHEGGRPEALYRRLGFRDEVYWYQPYSPNSDWARRNHAAK